MSFGDNLLSLPPKPATQNPALSKPDSWRLDELADSDIPEPETFFADTLARTSILLLAGRRGSGKTYLTLGMGAAIATGKPFGPYNCRQGKVLYVSQEMGKAAIRKRIRRLFPDPSDRALIGENFTGVCKHRFKLDSDESAQPLIQLVSLMRPDVLFIDALRDVKGSCRESDNDEMGELMVRLRDEVALPFNCAIVLVHHKGKPGQDGQDRGSRGASAIEDVAEDVIYLTAEKGQDRRTGLFDKTREGSLEGSKFWYEIASEVETPDVVTLTVGAATEDDEESDSDIFKAKKLAELLSLEGAMTKDEIMARMAWSLTTAKRALKAGRDADILNRSKSGGRGPGSKAMYEVHERFQTAKWENPNK